MATNTNITTITTSKTITRKLSTAVGLLSFAAFIVQGLSTTWGFESIGEQIVQTALLFSGAINVFFLGSTTQKNIAEKTEEEEATKTTGESTGDTRSEVEEPKDESSK